MGNNLVLRPNNTLFIRKYDAKGKMNFVKNQPAKPRLRGSSSSIKKDNGAFIDSGLLFPVLNRYLYNQSSMLVLITRPAMYKNIYYSNTMRSQALYDKRAARMYRIPVPCMRYALFFQIWKGKAAPSQLLARALVDGKEFFYPLPNIHKEDGCLHLDEGLPSDVTGSRVLVERCANLIDQYWSHGFNNNMLKQAYEPALVDETIDPAAYNPFTHWGSSVGEPATPMPWGEYLQKLSEMSISDVVRSYRRIAKVKNNVYIYNQSLSDLSTYRVGVAGAEFELRSLL